MAAKGLPIEQSRENGRKIMCEWARRVQKATKPKAACLALDELIHANKTVSAVSGKDAGAGTVDFIEVPDHAARARGLDMYFSIVGAYADKAVKLKGDKNEPVVVKWLE